MATYKKRDLKELFFEGIKAKKKEKVEAEPIVEMDDYTPSLDVATDYTDGAKDDASYGDLVELLSVLDEEHYNEVADILLDYMDETYGIDDEEFAESEDEEDDDKDDKSDSDDDKDDKSDSDDNDDDDDDDDDKDLEEDAEFNEAIEAFLAEEGLDINEAELTEDELVEIAKRFKGFVKSRKFFKKTASKLKVGRLKNKTALRVKRIKGRVQRKKTRFARKKYQKSRSQAIKIGKHVVKKHRGLK